MIVDNLGVKMLNEDECVLTGNIVQNNIPILEENYVAKMNSNNGFSEQRMFRKIASIPVIAQLQATQAGYNLDDKKDLMRFLADNPDYMSVERIKSGGNKNYIIK
jgi:hypothetical protein